MTPYALPALFAATAAAGVLWLVVSASWAWVLPRAARR